MLQIPKNVMQIGEVNPHTKIYMEDYVHTFLERRKKAEEYLAFGKKEERDGILYYLIYGVEKRTDWDRGSYPYFKKYERIGTIEGAKERRVFKPVRGSGIPLDGYFIFYEQNEDMQSYMIVVRETEEIAGSEEKEEVMEAVRTHREQRKKELEAEQARADREQEETLRKRVGKGREEAQKEFPGREREELLQAQSGFGTQPEKNADRLKSQQRVTLALQKKAKKNATFTSGKKEKRTAFHLPAQTDRQPKTHSWTIPDLCRAGSMILLLLLVVMGLTSINQYPDMKAVVELFSDAAKELGAEKGSAVAVDAKPQEDGLIVEETTVGGEESAEVAEAVMDETDAEENLVLAEDSDGSIQWMIGQQDAQEAQETVSGEAETDNEHQESDASETADAQQAEMTEGGLQSDAGAQNAATQSEPPSPSETVESADENATQAIARPTSYVVKKGDSLAGIARKFYGNASMVTEICNINKIENPDHIRPGQNILLP